MQDDQDEEEPQIPTINSPVAKSLPLLNNGAAPDPSMFNQNLLDDPTNGPQSGSLKETGQHNNKDQLLDKSEPGGSST